VIKYLSKISKKNLKGTAVLALDFNTEDEWRMEITLPTVRLLSKAGCRVLILSHRGRPKGVEPKLSQRKNARDLGRMMNQKVFFIPHFRFKEIKTQIDNSPKGSIFVLENMRFLKGEYDNDPKLAKKIAEVGDFYVNDAFPNSHRDDVSVDAIARFLPSYAGLQMEQEIKHLSRIMKKPKKPLVVVVGGGKADDKVGVLKYFKNKADRFLVGGAVANTLLLIDGKYIGDSIADRDREDRKKFYNILRFKNLVMPVDFKWSGGKMLDISKETIKVFRKEIRKAGTIIWNGPLGFIEKKNYEEGSLDIARAIAQNKRAFSLAGGGETVMFLKKYNLDKKFTFISTGGGAMLDFLAGKRLPGIEALRNSKLK